MTRPPWEERPREADPPPSSRPEKRPVRYSMEEDSGLEGARSTSTRLRGRNIEANVAWKRLLRLAGLVLLFGAVATWFDRWTTRSALNQSINQDVIMGFDSHLLSSTEAYAASKGYTLGPDGVQGWLLGEDRRWAISVHVRLRAAVVVPYHAHLVFENDIPFMFQAESRARRFLDDGWYFDQAMVDRARYAVHIDDSSTRDQVLEQMQQRVRPVP